jgi:SAM-dependent methyltransferase
MTSTQFDPIAFKADSRADWDAMSPAWEVWRDAFESGAASVTAKLLELGGVRPGQAVLDVATGQGEPALSAARVVGPTGRVVGIDASPGMLEIARRRAHGQGNIEFVEADMESLGHVAGPFDVVLSRFGLMFATDHIAAFRALAELLAAGGVLAAAVWGPPSSHGVSIGPAALVERLGLQPPAAGMPGPFSMSDPARLVEEVTAAGFAGVSVAEHIAPFRFRSVDEYVRFNKAMLPPRMMKTVEERFESGDDPDAWAIVARAVERYVDGDGTLALPSTALCLRAVTRTL